MLRIGGAVALVGIMLAQVVAETFFRPHGTGLLKVRPEIGEFGRFVQQHLARKQLQDKKEDKSALNE